MGSDEFPAVKPERSASPPKAAASMRSRYPRLLRWWRYTASSAVAAATSQLTFLLLYGSGLAGAPLASVLSVLAGVPPKFVLSRWWVWERRGAPRFLDEVVPYLAVVAVTGAASALLTGLAESVIDERVTSHAWRVGLVSAAFFTVMAGMFVARYVLCQRLVFADRAGGTKPRP